MFKEELVFELSGPQLSEAEINQIIPYNFKGKEAFVKFYHSQNGGYFRDGAYIFRKNFYKLSEDDRNSSFGIESFYYIPNSEKKYALGSIFKNWDILKESEEAEEFAQTHMPFASDAGGNPFWINLFDGQIKYTDHEDGYNPIIIAPSFYDFYTNIQGSLF